MVAKIISGKSLMGALNYNENKVTRGSAELIGINGYAKDLPQLTFYDKINRLKDLATRNDRVKTNTVHISLNFAVGEELPKEKLNQIAGEYMAHIGFGNQPFLVYHHFDAGHPHVHIVSTNIKSSGERISLHNLGRTKSEEARKALEIKYGLIQASKMENGQNQTAKLMKAEYGKTDTKRSIANVVNGVVQIYKFTSLPELNAILSHYNVAADRGSKESRMYSKNGLIYWVLDNRGRKVGVPIKASSIYGKPTLKILEEKFLLNEELRKPHKERLKQSIDSVLVTKASREGFQKALQARDIQVVFRRNEEGRIYGVTFVDHRQKVVFNGSDLGKSYSSTALNERFANHKPDQPAIKSSFDQSSGKLKYTITNLAEKSPAGLIILDDLLKNEYPEGMTSEGMIQNKRKKKRKRLTG